MAARIRREGRAVGRYVLYGEIAAGGMATVHIGRLRTDMGFSRTVAIKRLHAHFAKDPVFRAMFMDEARLAARISHPNVVSIIDVAAFDGELLLVMEYVQGESLARLLRAREDGGGRMPPAMVVRVMSDVLHGLHAAHEARSENGEPLGIVHRDVSPQNVLVGADGVSRVVDFGVAKAAMRSQSTQDGQVKGKLSYMAPEQVKSERVDRRADVFAAGVVAWEALTGERLFASDHPAGMLQRILSAPIPTLRSVAPDLPPALDAVVMRALERSPQGRYESARSMAIALERALAPSSAAEVGEWVSQTARDALDHRARQVSEVESVSAITTSLRRGAARDAGVQDSGVVTRRFAPEGVDATAAPSRRSWVLALVAGAALVAAAAAILVAFESGRRVGAGVQAPRSAPASTAVPGPSLAGAPWPSSAPSPSSAPAVHYEVPVEALPAATSDRPTPAGAPRAEPRRAPAGAPAVRPGCSPPYTIDSSGFRVLKPECL